jgi:hemerythrin-like domain-containing protein
MASRYPTGGAFHTVGPFAAAGRRVTARPYQLRDERDEMPDVIDQIEHDHREVEQLFAEFNQSGDRTQALKICEELDKHTKAEDKAVYPIFADELSDEKSKVAEASEEHKEARQLIGQIRNTEDPGHLRELMTELEAAVQHHVHEEETEMLPKARRELPAEELDELAEKFEAAKDAAA